MTDPATASPACPVCRTPVPADSPDGGCPECLLRAALGATPGPLGGARAPAMTIDEANARFPQFEVLSLLGQGGMGVVWKARQRSLDRFVALKVLPAEVAAAPGFADRFQREARALARLDHPNIVHVYESGTSDGLFYLAMEFVDGTNLRQAMEAKAIRPREALAIVPQICDALQYAHDHGVVHRDVKPENVLLDRAGRVKVADFGIAKLMSAGGPEPNRTLTGQVMGTPHYMAPEQIEHPTEVDHRADIYSLGVVFYEMLTGELPLGRFAAPSRKVQVDVRLDEIVLRTLEKEREARYQRVAEVRTDVDAVVADPPATEAPTTASRADAGAERDARTSVPAAPSVGRLAPLARVKNALRPLRERARPWLRQPAVLVLLAIPVTTLAADWIAWGLVRAGVEQVWTWLAIRVVTQSALAAAGLVCMVRARRAGAARAERWLATWAAVGPVVAMALALAYLPSRYERARAYEIVRNVLERNQTAEEDVRARDDGPLRARYRALQDVHGAQSWPALREFYAPDDRAVLDALPDDVRIRRGAAGEFGLPLLPSEIVGAPLIQYDLQSWNWRERNDYTVWLAFRPRPGDTYRQGFHVKMVRRDGVLYFDLQPIKVP